MKYFTEQSGSFSDKVNYVDQNNRVLGYDMTRDCCEAFGHGVYAALPQDSMFKATESPADLGPYIFADEAPNGHKYEDDGDSLSFRIIAPDLPDLFVVIWNYHNGYYSHGWTWSNSSTSPATDGRI